MVSIQLLLAGSSIFGLSVSAPINSFFHFTRSLQFRAPVYKVYSGDGSMAQGWPSMSSWIDYESMWTANSEVMTRGCLGDWGEQNSAAEIEVIRAGIEESAAASGLDRRFILAVMMQESNGCVRVKTTYSPPPDNIRNPGLMQDHNGEHTCFDANRGIGPLLPCPDDQIKGMIADGVMGTAAGDGLRQTVSQAQTEDDSKYYKGARIYNSGSIDPSGNLGKGVATHCYASDIANRVQGWLGDGRLCDESTIGYM